MADSSIILPCILLPYLVALIIKATKMSVSKWVPYVISGGLILAYLIIYPLIQEHLNHLPTQTNVLAILGRILTTLMLTAIAVFFQALFNFVMKVKYK